MSIDNLHNSMRDLPILMAIQDIENRFIAATQSVSNICIGTNNPDQLIGLNNFDLHDEVAKNAERFNSENLEVITQKITLKHLVIQRYADNNIHVLLCEKHPKISSTGAAEGVYCQAMDLSKPAIQIIANRLLKYMDYYLKEPDISLKILKNDSDNLLSDRELECLFYFLRGKTCKDIGKTLGLSHRTIEAYLAKIKLKFEVETKSQLIEKAIELGYLYSMPGSLLCETFSIGALFD